MIAAVVFAATSACSLLPGTAGSDTPAPGRAVDGAAQEMAAPGTCKELGGGWTYRFVGGGVDVGLDYHGGPADGLTYDESVRVREGAGWSADLFESLPYVAMDYRGAADLGYEGSQDQFRLMVQRVAAKFRAAPDCGPPGQPAG